jgi:hypothetical protein
LGSPLCTQLIVHIVKSKPAEKTEKEKLVGEIHEISQQNQKGAQKI